MIRIVVLVLAAANLLFLGWSRWVREATPRLVAPSSAPLAATTTAAPAAAAVPCATVGPLHDEVHAMEVEQLLRDMQLVPLRRTVTAQARDGWWVHVASPDAATQARTLRTIQQSGIGDAFAMPEDPQHRVSVGLFSQEPRARNRADAIRALRLEPVVAERMAQETSFWFELRGTAPAAVDLQHLRAEGVDTGALRVEACEDGDEMSIDAILPADGATAEATQDEAV